MALAFEWIRLHKAWLYEGIVSRAEGLMMMVWMEMLLLVRSSCYRYASKGIMQ
jgi:hypothetical protein